MEYHIKYQDEIIASFIYQGDRDNCLSYLEQIHDDCKDGFEAVDD